MVYSLTLENVILLTAFQPFVSFKFLHMRIHLFIFFILFVLIWHSNNVYVCCMYIQEIVEHSPINVEDNFKKLWIRSLLVKIVSLLTSSVQSFVYASKKTWCSKMSNFHRQIELIAHKWSTDVAIDLIIQCFTIWKLNPLCVCVFVCTVWP